MSKDHNFKVNIIWTGNSGEGTKLIHLTAERMKSPARENRLLPVHPIRNFEAMRRVTILKKCWSPRFPPVIFSGICICVATRAWS